MKRLIENYSNIIFSSNPFITHPYSAKELNAIDDLPLGKNKENVKLLVS
jgi:hypothetical protein